MKKKLYPPYPVLVVDDEDDFLNSIQMTLKRKGITNVECCNKGAEVMPMLKEKKYSLILLDIIMPDIRGDDLLPKIIDNYLGIPVIMLTALNDTEIAFQCVQKGARDYLVKPVDSLQLLEKIRGVLDSTEQMQAAIRRTSSEAVKEKEDHDYYPKEFNFTEEVQKILQESTGKLESEQEVTLNVMTVFLADLVGATAAKQEYGHSKGMKRCYVHNLIAAETIKRFNGTVIKFMGDAVLAAFYSNFDAVIASLAFREALHTVNLPGEEFQVPLETRIVLTTGAVEEFNTDFGYDIGGQVVDKAARLEKVASPGQILVEAGVIDHIRLILERMTFVKIPGNIDISELQLNGLKDPVRVIEITTNNKPFGNPPSEEGQYIFSLIDAISNSKSRVLLSTPSMESTKNRKVLVLLQDRLLEAQNKRGVDVRILCSGCDPASLVAAAEFEKFGIKVRFCGETLEDAVNLIDKDVVIFGFKNQNPSSPGNKYLKMTSLHINSALASDFMVRWNESISPESQIGKIFV